jgi:hypothetical protein
MSLMQILAATGALTWGWLAWRAYRYMRELPNRLRWAMWPRKRAKALRRYG